MKQLNQDSLNQITTVAPIGSYDRNTVQAGIVHFGVGNFHRCHQAVYIDKLLSKGYTDWGIVGVSMRSSQLRNSLAPQDFLYTQVTLSEDTKFRIISSILNILVAPENPKAVISQVADSDIKLVTATITEKGYCLASGSIDTRHSDLLSDIESLDAPQTIYGYLAAAIIQRCKQNSPPFTILCCDNVQGGGEILNNGVQMLLQEHSTISEKWATKHVSFASSMVDRVSPPTSDSLKQLVSTSLGVMDVWPVSAEPFSQWVIEDNFAGEKPPLDEVEAQFSNDVSLYEQTKLRLLNAAHSIVSILGYLNNSKSVHQALEQTSILQFALSTLHENVLPVTKLPLNFNGQDYISGVITRFHNASVPYAVQQVNTDSSLKIQQRWFPTIDAALAQNKDTTFMSFSIAAWTVYVEKALVANELNDPFLNEFQDASQEGKEVISRFLLIADADRFKFFKNSSFMSNVLGHYQTLKKTTVTAAIDQLLQEYSNKPVSKGEEVNHV